MKAPTNILDNIKASIEVNDAEDTKIAKVEAQRVSGAHGQSQTYSLIITDLDGLQWLVAATRVLS